jgi:hypothetical protein
MKEAAESRDILKEAAKLKHLAATEFNVERVSGLTAFLASRKLSFLTEASLGSLRSLLMNDTSRDLIDAVILTAT